MSLQDFKDSLSKSAFGITKQQAIRQGICISCRRKDPLSHCKTDAGQKEYYISGMCEECFDSMFSKDEKE